MGGSNAHRKDFRLFQYPRTIIQKVIRKLSSTDNDKDSINPRLAVMGATTLCIATQEEGPILTTVFTGQKWKFGKYCQSAKTGTLENDRSQHEEAINHQRSLCSTVLKPVLNALHDKLPKTKETITLYKGLQAPNIQALRKAVDDLKQGLPRSWVWSSSLETAINEATPNKGRKGKLSIVDRRLFIKGYSNLVTNHAGIVLSYQTTAIPIADLTPTVSTDEFFVHFDPCSSWDIQTANNPSGKAQLLCPTLPPTPQPALTKIIDSDLWLAIITNSGSDIADTTIPHPNRSTNCVTPNKQISTQEFEKQSWIQTKPTSLSETKPEDTPFWGRDQPTLDRKLQLPESSPRSLPATKSTSNTQSINNELTKLCEPLTSHQTFRLKSGKESLVVNTQKDSTPKHRLPCGPVQPKTRIPKVTLTEIPRSSWPTRIVIQKHSFWRMSQDSPSVQRWVFDIAKNRNHKVCIVLLWRKSRLYGSFTNAEALWEYYSRFQDRRCFYWINRSYEIKEEASTLRFDIEWFTKNEDESATEKLS